MALRDWLAPARVATATPATPATHEAAQQPTVATVATVAVAKPQNLGAERPLIEAVRDPELARAPVLFDFMPPTHSEALEERACIIAEGCGMDYAQALQEARWQAEREQAWSAFRRNAERILGVPEAQRPAVLERYEAEAASRYGESVARDMAETMRRWAARHFPAMPG